MFIFKRKEVVIDAFTSHREVHDFFPIEESYKFIPEWWKKIPKKIEIENDFVDSIPTMTMKHCAGIIDYYKNGYILPLWSDVKIKTTTDSFSYQFSSDFCEIENHGDYQHNNFFSDHQHAKLLCPWYLRSKSHEKFLCTMPTWNLYNFWQKFFILPGVVEFNYNSSLHLNVFLKRENDSFLLESGTPVYYISPMTDKKIKIKKHLVTESEIKRNIYGNPFFTNKIMKMKKFKKIFGD